MDVMHTGRAAARAPAATVRASLLAVGTLLAGSAALRFALPYLARLDGNARIDDLVSGALIGVGVLLTGWYLLTALLGLLCLIARGTGAMWRQGEAALSRAGAPILRRALGAGAGAALVTGSLLGPAYAEPADSAEIPVDLTWAGEHGDEDPESGPAGDTPDGELTGNPTDSRDGSTASQGQDVTSTQSPSGEADSRQSTGPGGDPTEPGQTDGPPQQGSAAEGAESLEVPLTQADEPGPESEAGDGSQARTDDERTPEDDANRSGSEPDPHSPDTDGEASARAGNDLGAGRESTTGGLAQAYTVRPGDSLWRIAAAHLPDGASDTAIAEHWPRWYEVNAETIGPDPDRIHPGQRLDSPERSTR